MEVREGAGGAVAGDQEWMEQVRICRERKEMVAESGPQDLSPVLPWGRARYAGCPCALVSYL